MNLGAENRKKVIAAASLGLIAVVAVIWQFSDFFGGGSSSADSTTVTATTPSLPVASRSGTRQRGNTSSRIPGKKDAGSNLDPSLRFDLLRTTEDRKYEGTGRNIFRVFVEPPPRPIVPVTPQPQPTGPAAYVAPPLPPINLTFYGFATPAGGAKRIFLVQNGDVFVAKEGDIVNRRYKVVRISPNAVDILDVLSNNRQSIPLTQG